MVIVQNPQLDAFFNWINQHGFPMIMIILLAIVVYYAGKKLLSRIVKQIVKGTRQREWHRKDIEKRQNTLVHLFATVWRLLIIFAAGYALLREVFPDAGTVLAPLFASAGIIGIAVGFGAQALIKDFISGIFIISENQYRVGDIVDIEGFSGTVELIGARSTVLRDVDGNVHYFPNGMIQHVINKTMGYSMARFTLALLPSSDIEKVSAIINEVGHTLGEEKEWHHKILEAPKFVSINEISGNAIEIIVAGKTEPSDQWAVIAEMRRRLLDRFDTEKIKLATLPSRMGSSVKK